MEIKEYVAMRKEVLKGEVAALARPPHLVIIQANNNPASDAYIRGKLKDSAEIGALATLLKFDPSISESELLAEIAKVNADPTVDGLIVQLPLPDHIREDMVKAAVDPSKDVDGFHPTTTFAPCTPKGIVDYLAASGFAFQGKGIVDYLAASGFAFQGANAVVLGRSNIVGKPMAKMLLSKNCNVTVLHSKTTEQDKAFYIAHADLIVVAIGRLGFLDNRYQYKDTAYVVDVGINRGEDGKLHGDAMPGLPVKLQTPVPGGVGLLTRLALIENLVIAAKTK